MSQDEAEIHKMLTDMKEAWNRHDAKAWASLCAEDGDVVNVVGWWWKGRPQIEKKVGSAHAFIFRESTLTHDEVHIRFLTSQIAVVHVLWSLVGHKNPDGTLGQPRKGVETDVLQKQAGRWLMAGFHNTNSYQKCLSRQDQRKSDVSVLRVVNGSAWAGIRRRPHACQP